MLKAVLLTAALAAAALPAVTLADDDDRNQPSQCGYYSNQYCSTNGRNDNDRDDNDRDDRGRGRRHRHGNQNCTNPAGNQRGWCRNQNGGYYDGHQWVQNPNGYNGQYNGQYPYGYNQQQSQITGVITSINGSTITIVRGLNAQSIDAQPAFSRGSVNGQLYPSRQITAVGVYDQNGYFHAYSIQ